MNGKMQTTRLLVMAFLLMGSLCGIQATRGESASTSKPAVISGLTYTRTQDVVYGRVYGTALTMDVLTPMTKSNGAAVILVVSGGWISSHAAIGSPFFSIFVNPFTSRGYTVFAVCHACQPKFTIDDIVKNINRSVRYIRFHAADYHIDPNRIGITGASAGAHLSLMQALRPEPEDTKSADPIDKMSSHVQAVGCFFPPTDFLNWGKPGLNVLDAPNMAPFLAAFDFHEFDDKTHKFERISSHRRIDEIEKDISPIYGVSKDNPPTLVLQGDADRLVPMQQAESLIKKMKAAGATAELYIKHGGGHGWGNIEPDVERVADWFDRYLPAKPPTTQEEK